MRSLTFALGALLALSPAPLEPLPPLLPGTSAPPPGHLVTGTVRATVRTGATLQPLQGVRLRVDGTALGGVTNAEGRALILQVPAGRHTLVANLAGYGEARELIEVTDGAVTAVTVDLQPAPEEFEAQMARLRLGEAARRFDVAAALPLGVSAERVGFADHFRRGDPPFNTESYGHIVENPFLSARDNPLSTFSIDVDRASYSNVRRFLRDGRRPPIDAVRIEELINYFTYDDPSPEGDASLSVTTEVSRAPWQPLHHLVRVGLKGRSIDMEAAPPNNLVFLIDVSGSMQPGNKLPLLKTAFRMLVDQLRAEDQVAIVVYAGAAGLVLPPTSGAERETILDALSRLEAGGSTAGGAGLQLAYDVAAKHHLEGGNNRIILATDGDFNVGPSSDSEMVRLIEDRRRQGTFLTVLGFGTGNLKDAKMEQLADHGNGNFAYIDGPLEAKKVLVQEMGGTLVTIAKDVKLQVEFNPRRVAAYRLIGYENRLLAAEDFDDDTKDAGELGAGHSVTALYEVIPIGVAGTAHIRSLEPLRYQPEFFPEPATAGTDELLFVKLRYKAPDGDVSDFMSTPLTDRPTEEPSANLRFASAVAAWGMLLRDSEYVGDFSLRDVRQLAAGALGEDRGGYRAEFLKLVEATGHLGLLEKEPGR